MFVYELIDLLVDDCIPMEVYDCNGNKIYGGNARDVWFEYGGYEICAIDPPYNDILTINIDIAE